MTDDQKDAERYRRLRGFAEWLLEAYHSDDGMPEAKDIAREARAVLDETIDAAMAVAAEREGRK